MTNSKKAFSQLSSIEIKELAVAGWTVEGISPPELRHRDGSLVRGSLPVDCLVDHLLGKSERKLLEEVRVKNAIFLIDLAVTKMSLSKTELSPILANPTRGGPFRDVRLSGVTFSSPSIAWADVVMTTLLPDCGREREPYLDDNGQLAYSWSHGRGSLAVGEVHSDGSITVNFPA